jgi:hypothetical protein
VPTVPKALVNQLLFEIRGTGIILHAKVIQQRHLLVAPVRELARDAGSVCVLLWNCILVINFFKILQLRLIVLGFIFSRANELSQFLTPQETSQDVTLSDPVLLIFHKHLPLIGIRNELAVAELPAEYTIVSCNVFHAQSALLHA